MSESVAIKKFYFRSASCDYSRQILKILKFIATICVKLSAANSKINAVFKNI